MEGCWTNNKGDFEENLKNFSPNHEQRFYRKGDFANLEWRNLATHRDYSDIKEVMPHGNWKLIQEEWDTRSYYEEHDFRK